METAPIHRCGNCGSEIYCVEEPVFCPVCRYRWKYAKWYIPPAVGSEKWLKYHSKEAGNA